MPPNRFESEVESFLEGSHGDRTHIKRADHHTVTPLCGTLLAGCTPGVWDSAGASGEYLRGSRDVEGNPGHRTVSVSTRGATQADVCPPAGPSREARDGPRWGFIALHLDRNGASG